MALEMGIPSEPRKLATLAEKGEIQNLDIAEANGRRCFMVLGFGMDGEIVRRMEEQRSGTMKKLDYFPAVLNTLRNWRPEPQRVTIDNEDLGEFDFGIIANVSTYGTWALQLGPCEYDDGHWEVYLIRKADLPGTSVAAGAALLGSLRHAPGVVHRRAREVTIQGAQGSPFQIDGDFGGNSPVNFKLQGFQLPLLVPQK
jgi:diacylglycerol kinase (ATP)